VNGPITVAQLKKSGSGTVSIKVVALAKRGAIVLVPPNPGSSACARLELGGGDRYHVSFPPPPDVTVKKNDAKSFLVKDALVEELCTLPICGNGITEPGESCDGGPFCDASCVANITSCCFVPGQCATLPNFSLLATLQGICSTTFEPFGSGQVIGGGVCQTDGSCMIESISPLSACCQRFAGCDDAVVSDTGALWSFHNLCQGGGPPGRTSPGAHCVAGTCVAP